MDGVMREDTRQGNAVDPEREGVFGDVADQVVSGIHLATHVQCGLELQTGEVAEHPRSALEVLGPGLRVQVSRRRQCVVAELRCSLVEVVGELLVPDKGLEEAMSIPRAEIERRGHVGKGGPVLRECHTGTSIGSLVEAGARGQFVDVRRGDDDHGVSGGSRQVVAEGARSPYRVQGEGGGGRAVLSCLLGCGLGARLHHPAEGVGHLVPGARPLGIVEEPLHLLDLAQLDVCTAHCGERVPRRGTVPGEHLQSQRDHVGGQAVRPHLGGAGRAPVLLGLLHELVQDQGAGRRAAHVGRGVRALEQCEPVPRGDLAAGRSHQIASDLGEGRDEGGGAQGRAEGRAEGGQVLLGGRAAGARDETRQAVADRWRQQGEEGGGGLGVLRELGDLVGVFVDERGLEFAAAVDEDVVAVHVRQASGGLEAFQLVGEADDPLPARRHRGCAARPTQLRGALAQGVYQVDPAVEHEDLRAAPVGDVSDLPQRGGADPVLAELPLEFLAERGQPVRRTAQGGGELSHLLGIDAAEFGGGCHGVFPSRSRRSCAPGHLPACGVRLGLGHQRRMAA
uniref:FunC1 n=1 Tax=Streptosporangium sp. KD35 TaxID=2162663 RepID=A0A2U9KD53_9ACTN|nr:FunC1 [Streptosporangium sp. KD35]